MKEEIKVILDKLYLDFEKANITAPEYSDLRDYITNLQKEVEDLREDNYAYHQLMKMQNKREYRSKFLKEFQQEYNTNTFPDYDEIYKRYDKLKKENKRLKNLEYKFFDNSGDEESFTLEDYLELGNKLYDLQEENELLTKARYSLDRVELERRIDKALAKINNMFDLGNEDTIIDDLLQLESILKGDIK